MFAVYGLLSNAGTIRMCLNKFSSTYSNELSARDRQLFTGLTRRVNAMLRPLNFLMMEKNACSVDRGKTMTSEAIQDCLGLLEEIQHFIEAASYSKQGDSKTNINQNQANTKVNNQMGQSTFNSATLTVDLEHYCNELDSALQNLQFCIQI